MANRRSVQNIFETIFNATTSAIKVARTNSVTTLLASAARTATVNSEDQSNYDHSRLLLYIDVTASSATPSVTPSIQGKDSVSGNYDTIWTASSALDGTVGTYTYYFDSGISGGDCTELIPFTLPCRTWRLVMTHGDADSITYSVSAEISP